MDDQAPTPRLLSIAGSDSGGGAGIQADLKAFAACGVHGMTVITAITAQSTLTVTDVHPVPAPMILAQARAVIDDIGVDAVKVGMLGTATTIAAVGEILARLDPAIPVVLDPVMVSESGSDLLLPEARAALVELLPRVDVVTPNLAEAAVLAQTEADPEDLARAIHELGPVYVVVTGGHGKEATDTFFDGESLHSIPGPREPGGAAHGSGCTHSSALAAHLALGRSPLEAAREAKGLAAGAVRRGLRDIGAGAGPFNALDIAARRRRTSERPFVIIRP
ncbi:MAG: bifunctional hydroxymethylpyrimidine kinase/phosphomethylpyrimidine kinase [Solirubrobacteraceae bacterium]